MIIRKTSGPPAEWFCGGKELILYSSLYLLTYLIILIVRDTLMNIPGDIRCILFLGWMTNVQDAFMAYQSKGVPFSNSK